MPKVDFATLVFRGARFDGARMPVDVLPELAAYRALIVAVAKALFQEKNPKRTRVPKGFEASFQLVLDRVEPGASAIDVLARNIPDRPIALFGDYFEAARDEVERTISEAGSDAARIPKGLAVILPRLSIFGKTLQGDESITIARPGQVDGARFDRPIRERILRMSNTSYEDDVDLIGEVCEADKDRVDFEFATGDGLRVPVNRNDVFFPSAKQYFYNDTVVRLRGIGLYAPGGALQRVISVTDLTEREDTEDALPSLEVGACPTSVDTQIEELRRLTGGWLDETSTEYASEALSWTAGMLNAIVASFGIPTPYIYPAPEGAVRAEWSALAIDVVANIDPQRRAVEVVSVRDIDHVSERTIDLNEKDGVDTFARAVRDGLTAA